MFKEGIQGGEDGELSEVQDRFFEGERVELIWFPKEMTGANLVFRKVTDPFSWLVCNGRGKLSKSS